ncbi:hypothetical protein TWF506_006273 [Arthrobotrys conoides]|uniref:Uncharacterized protein n=1 Tax=Arthrobotrys conoides TaxID=74498 RepID=A0AAN8RYN3_9PEZI
MYILVIIFAISKISYASPIAIASGSFKSSETIISAVALQSAASTVPTSLESTSTASHIGDTTLTPNITKTTTLDFTLSEVISTSKPVPKASETSILNNRVVDPSFFYVSPMAVYCSPYEFTIRRLQGFVSGEIPYSPATGIPQPDWAAAVEQYREIVERTEEYGQDRFRRIAELQGCCSAYHCNQNGRLVPSPNPPRDRGDTYNYCGGAWETLRCIYMLTRLGQPVIQAGTPLATTPIHEFQEAIDRIPESVRVFNPTWEWQVAPALATHIGQRLSFRQGGRGENIAPSGEPPFYLGFMEGQPPHNPQPNPFMDSLFDFGRWDQDQEARERGLNVAPSGEPPFYLEFAEEQPPQGSPGDPSMDSLFGFGKWDRDHGPGGSGKGREFKKRDNLSGLSNNFSNDKNGGVLCEEPTECLKADRGISK